MGWIIGGLIAALVGSGMQMYAQNAATKKAQARLNAANYELMGAQDKINEQIAEATAGYETNKREQNQAQEAARIADDIKADVADSQAIRDEQQTTAGNVSNDYVQARKNSSAKTNEQANAFADLIGQIRSAGALRLGEGYRLNRYGENIDQLAKNARGNYLVGQSEAQDALHSKDGLANLGKIVQAVGAVASMYGGMAAGAGAAANAASGTSAGLSASAQGVHGMTAAGTGASGIKMANAGQALLGGTGGSSTMWSQGIPYLLGGGYAAQNLWGNS